MEAADSLGHLQCEPDPVGPTERTMASVQEIIEAAVRHVLDHDQPLLGRLIPVADSDQVHEPRPSDARQDLNLGLVEVGKNGKFSPLDGGDQSPAVEGCSVDAAMAALSEEAVGRESTGGSHQLGAAELPDAHRLITTRIGCGGGGGCYFLAVPVVRIACRDGGFSIAGDVTSHMNGLIDD